MILKKQYADGKEILSIIDDDLLEKRFEEGNKILDFSSDFYKGEKKTRRELKKEIMSAYIINAAGKKTISFLSELKLIDNKSIKFINKIPYTNLLLIK
ncbi:MAG: DUF424 family protein [Candidatus Woesearchaeota archaeon]